MVLHGPIATNILNIYSCSLCAQTLDWKLNRRKIALLVGAIALGFTVYLVFQSSFANTLDSWLSGLVMWIAPWGTVTLIHYYYFLRQEIDVDLLYDPPGHSRDRGRALVGDHRLRGGRRRRLVLRVRRGRLADGPGCQGASAMST